MPGAIAGTDRFYSKVVIAKSVPSRRRPPSQDPAGEAITRRWAGDSQRCEFKWARLNLVRNRWLQSIQF
ncbi:hypothetical protein SRABI89_01833 [Pseudomonas koreensis]|nr:hypothetical protein SRABI89_01833 [Pseudomonas koreensis]